MDFSYYVGFQFVFVFLHNLIQKICFNFIVYWFNPWISFSRIQWDYNLPIISLKFILPLSREKVAFIFQPHGHLTMTGYVVIPSTTSITSKSKNVGIPMMDVSNCIKVPMGSKNI